MIRAVGLVIYTYTTLENHLDDIWQWFQEVEKWFGLPYSELIFFPQNKRPGKVLDASQTNRKRLYNRLQKDIPWSLISFGAPKGILNSSITDDSGAIDVTIKSWPPAKHGQESYRTPSYMSIQVSPDMFHDPQKIAGFIELGIKAWSIAEGTYGFIDLDTGIPPNDNFIRNTACILSNLIPPRYVQEFKEWQSIQSKLNKRIWKVFWGNYLSQEHIQQLGGYAELRRADYYRPQAEILEESWQAGKKIVYEKLSEVLELPDKGFFFKLSQTPLNWEKAEIQQKRRNFQEILSPMSIKNYSL